ncbi:ABC transporter ATP-binding protein [Acaryochloris sp. IP29b_bin.137]|uniref:ABC transporter ATP-binding protein n=1 Tax=Acaryochloris sp. IP29b_bin.137 TaxID=2969217 RepID=UPI00261DBB85|nr:ABC transporter ATP-binding protein [Acaryochloris sp. IP29b_bin.137]
MATGLFKARLGVPLYFIPALRLVWQSSPYWTLARLGLVLIQGILPLFTIYMTKLIVDQVTVSLALLDPTAAMQDIVPLLIGAAGLVVGTTLCASLMELVTVAHAQRVTDYMQSIIHAKSISADLEHYENAQYYDALQRAQQEAPYRPPRLLDRFAQAGQSSISLIAMVGLLLALHWGIVGFLLVAAIPTILVRLKFAGVMYHWKRRRTQLERQAMYLGWLQTSDLFAKEIRLFNLGEHFKHRYAQLREQIYQEKVGIISKRSFAFFGTQTIVGVFIFAIFVYLVQQALVGTLKLGDLVLYYQALQKGQNSLRGLLSSLSGLYEDNLFLANLYEFLDLKSNLKEPDLPTAFPIPLATGITFNKVSFQYATTQRKAIQNVSIKLQPGQVIALVGENGSGKTTLIKLLCRLYDPTAGNITIDGIDLRHFSTHELRSHISVIFQDYAKYHFSARNNIRLGHIESPADQLRIQSAAQLSGADRVIQSLPQGYDTILGKMFDQGEELSIGQWQKIALARAFLRESQVIVLDEPTSAMDPRAEYEVFQQFRELIQDQSAILISHRLSTVKMADYIYVMSGGRIIEEGSHAALMALNGSYASMFETQAQNYR